VPVPGQLLGCPRIFLWKYWSVWKCGSAAPYGFCMFRTRWGLPHCSDSRNSCPHLLVLQLGHHQTDLFLGRGAAVHDAADLAAAQHQNPVAQLQQHIQIFADIDDGHALHLLVGHQVVNGVGSIDIQTAHSVGGHQNRWIHGDFAANQNLLHVAAGELPDGSGDAGRDNFQFLHHFFS